MNGDIKQKARELAEAHEASCRQAMINLGHTLNDGAASGHRGGYYTGYLDGYSLSIEEIEKLKTEIERLKGINGLQEEIIKTRDSMNDELSAQIQEIIRLKQSASSTQKLFPLLQYITKISKQINKL